MNGNKDEVLAAHILPSIFSIPIKKVRTILTLRSSNTRKKGFNMRIGQ